MIRRLVALVFVLLTAAPASAAVGTGIVAAMEGFDHQNMNLSCGGATSQIVLDTSVYRTGGAALRLKRSSSVTGSCQVASSVALTGTIQIYFAMYLTAGGQCASTGDSTGGTLGNFGEVAINFSCANATNNYVMKVTEGGSDVGSSVTTLTSGAWVLVTLKIVTGAGSGSVEWMYSTDGVNWTSTGGASGGRTITNVSTVEFRHWAASSLVSFIELNIDDVLVLDDAGTSWPMSPSTFVNFRGAKTAAPTVNAWTKVGGDSTNIYTVWTQRTNPSLTYPGTQYADGTGGSGTGDTQTQKVLAWDSGTDPIPSSANGVDRIWGCRWDVYGGRGGGTTRTYAYRLYLGTAANPDDATFPVSFSNNSQWWRATNYFDTVSNAAQALTDLNAMELGGVKTSSSSGAPMRILDQWVQCAWTESVSASALMWVSE